MEQLDSSERLFDELSPKEKILVILASVKEPVHMDQIANFSELEEAVVIPIPNLKMINNPLPPTN